MTKNVYIHIPFCKSKCKYCSFISFPELEFKADYLESLYKEIKYYYKNELLKTLYFGGGTPSLLTVSETAKLISCFNINENTEVTMELNPESITEEYLISLKQAGVNRLSFGCQTFNNIILKQIGRRHNSSDVINVVKSAQNCGYDNISLDFIYGLPNQTLEDFEKDLKKALSLNIQHISLYGLKIDEGCYFYNNIPDNLPDEDMQADMYLKAIEILTSHGFCHYEISNFSKNEYESKHNLNYWDNNNYYGFGAAAHGYTDGKRYSNKSNIKNYIENPIEHESTHTLTQQEKLEEEIFLGFRKMSGINIYNINKKYNIDFLEKYSATLNKYTSLKYLSETNTGFKLTDNGILLGNLILSEFIE